MLFNSRNASHGKGEENDRRIKCVGNTERGHTFVPCCYVDWNARRTGLGSGLGKGSDTIKGTKPVTGQRMGSGTGLGTGTGSDRKSVV